MLLDSLPNSFFCFDTSPVPRQPTSSLWQLAPSSAPGHHHVTTSLTISPIPPRTDVITRFPLFFLPLGPLRTTAFSRHFPTSFFLFVRVSEIPAYEPQTVPNGLFLLPKPVYVDQAQSYRDNFFRFLYSGRNGRTTKGEAEPGIDPESNERRKCKDVQGDQGRRKKTKK